MDRRLHSVMTVVLGCALIVLSCTYTSKSKSEGNDAPRSVEDQLASGKPIYMQTCATSACHGTQGEGIKAGNGFSAWPLVGKDFQFRHPNAQIVFDVIRSGGERNLLALSDQQVYDAIAYELRQNEITLASPLTAENAFTTYGGAMSGKGQGGLFPPSDNAFMIRIPHMPHLPITVQNERLRIQIDQFAQTIAIGSDKPPEGGVYLILVLAVNDLDNEPITVSPNYLSLSTPSGELLKTRSTNIHSAIEKFHTQTIKSQHGTVGLVVFTLTAPDGFDQLMYDDGAGNQLTLALNP
jgi:mono/diheme cytochrome c family protein